MIKPTLFGQSLYVCKRYGMVTQALPQVKLDDDSENKTGYSCLLNILLYSNGRSIYTDDQPHSDVFGPL